MQLPGAAALPERGVALVIVLWMLMLLTVIATSVSLTARTEAQLSGNLVAQAQAEAAADAAIHRAIAALLVRTPEPGSWKSNGQEYPWSFDSASVKVVIRDEAAKVDLNTAPAVLLAGLFRAVGLAIEDAEALGDAVIDWRDPDDLRSLHGAERREYAESGRSYGPANAPFDSVEELRLVLGMNEDLFRSIRAFLTVHSQSVTVNAAAAERPVLMALPGATPSLVDTYIEQRRLALESGLPAPQFALAPSSGGASIHSIQAKVELGDNARFWREAVVWLTGNTSRPFVILTWRAHWSDNRQVSDSVNTP